MGLVGMCYKLQHEPAYNVFFFSRLANDFRLTFRMRKYIVNGIVVGAKLELCIFLRKIFFNGFAGSPDVIDWVEKWLMQRIGSTHKIACVNIKYKLRSRFDWLAIFIQQNKRIHATRQYSCGLRPIAANKDWCSNDSSCESSHQNAIQQALIN